MTTNSDHVLSKMIDLRGLSIYGGTGRLNIWESLTDIEGDIKEVATKLLAQIKNALPTYEKPGM